MAQVASCVIGGVTYTMPPLSIGALEDGAYDIIGRIGGATNGITQAGAMVELIAMAVKPTHPDVTLEQLRQSSTMYDFNSMNQAVIDLLHISGMGPQPEDPAPGEASAAS